MFFNKSRPTPPTLAVSLTSQTQHTTKAIEDAVARAIARGELPTQTQRPQPNTRLTYPPAGAAELRGILVQKLPAMPPQQAANAIADALAQVIARGAWPTQTAENMANLISRAVDDIARGRSQ